MKKRAVLAYMKLAVFGILMAGMVLFVWNIAFVAAGGGEQSGESVDLPILMYHSILDDASKAGDYIVTPAVLEADLLYLKENGYQTVFISELIDYVNGEGQLPEKPVLLTFDDGFYNNYTYLYPLLQKYGMKAVISIIGHTTEYFSTGKEKMNNNYAYLSWNQLQEMVSSGLIEIQNHTYDLHGEQRCGIVKASGESTGDFYASIVEDLEHLQSEVEKHLGSRPTALAYPFGALSKDTESIAKQMGFSCTLTCYEKLNIIEKGNPSSLYCLGRVNRQYGPSIEQILDRVYP